MKSESIAPEQKRIIASQLRRRASAAIARKTMPALTNDPLQLVDSGKLQIKTKDGRQVPLILNRCQRLVFDKVRRLRAAHKLVRIWILKFRQGGISTLCEAILYSLSCLQDNRTALVMADELEKAHYIHEMTKLYHRSLRETEPDIAPETQASNERKLAFAARNSQMLIKTADNVDAPRAHTTQYCHLSEFAFYRDLDSLLKALLQSVPDHWDSVILGETTANGEGTPAHRVWQAAEKGKSEWLAIFLPWFIHEEYERGAPEYPISEITFDRTGGAEAFLKEEEALRRQIHVWFAGELDETISDEQISCKLNWRRWAIINKCERQVRAFRVEYPANADEAWAVSGQPYYEPEVFIKQLAKKPLRTGYLVPGIERPEIRDSPDGPWEFLEWPKPDDRYIIPCDPSEGIEADEAAAIVRNVRTNCNDAEFASQRYDPDELAFQAHLASQLYGGTRNSVIVPERNGIGSALVSALRRLTGNIFREKVTEMGSSTTDREGWFTDTVSRPLMFEQLGKELREGSVKLCGQRSITELKRLVNNEGKPKAPPGGQDGLAICNAIASKVRSLRPPGLARESASSSGMSRPKPTANMGMKFSSA